MKQGASVARCSLVARTGSFVVTFPFAVSALPRSKFVRAHAAPCARRSIFRSHRPEITEDYARSNLLIKFLPLRILYKIYIVNENTVNFSCWPCYKLTRINLELKLFLQNVIICHCFMRINIKRKIKHMK